MTGNLRQVFSKAAGLRYHERRTIGGNAPEETPQCEPAKTMEHLLLAIFWIAWCAFHSGMISVTATEFFGRRLGTHYRCYRLVFNLLAVATVVPVMLYGRSLDGEVLFRWEGFPVVFQVLLLALAGFLFLAGARQYDTLQVLGVRQITTGESHGALTEAGQLSTSGILGVIRHPWYLGAIILIWVDYRSFTMATLVTNAVLTVYLLVGTVLEERKLVMELGEAYREYQKKVSMLFPFKWLRSLA